PSSPPSSVADSAASFDDEVAHRDLGAGAVEQGVVGTGEGEGEVSPAGEAFVGEAHGARRRGYRELRPVATGITHEHEQEEAPGEAGDLVGDREGGDDR